MPLDLLQQMTLTYLDQRSVIFNGNALRPGACSLQEGNDVHTFILLYLVFLYMRQKEVITELHLMLH